MRFNELMRRVGERGVKVVELRADGEGPEIVRVCEDSRKVQAGDLFVARGGSKTSGAKFAGDAIARGVVAVVSEEAIDLPAGVAFARVKNANLACALLAHEIAGNPTAGMKMIGITGTKGKTTVAYLLRSVLKAAGHTVGMIGTVEIDDGRAVTPAELTTPGAVELVEMFCRMRDNGVTHCIMEVSSHALHQHRVAGIDFAVAIFTNLTGDHLDYHKTMEEYAAAKARLFAGLKERAVAVVNADDEWAGRMVKKCKAAVVRYRIEGAQGRVPAEWIARIDQMTSERMQMRVAGGKGTEDLETRLVGRHNAYNLLAVIAGAQALWIHAKWIKAALREAHGAPGRLQRVESGADFSVFVDFAHTHGALENVLTAVRATMGGPDATADQRRDRKGAFRVAGDATLPYGRVSDVAGTNPPRLICVFGCGGDRDRTKRPKMGAVAERLADRVFVTSDNPRTEDPVAIVEEICAGLSPGWRDRGKITVEVDRRAAIRMAIAEARPGDVVVIAGKGHENYQIVGTTKHHFDDVEEAQAALQEVIQNHQDTKTPT